MIHHQNVGDNNALEQLAMSHLAQAEHFKLLKMASVNNSALYYQYGELEYYNKALEHKYKAMTAASAKLYSTVFQSNENKNETSQSDSLLLNNLRKGGYILYAKHGEATLGEDQANLSFQDCSTQRNLSENGKRQAITYGEVLNSLGIPLSYPIYTSPLCRARESGELGFGEENVQVDPFWFETYKLSGNLSEAERQSILNALKLALEIPPPPGSNKIIIAHSFPKGIGLGQISDMGTIVVKPRGQGKGYKVVAQVPLEDLTNLLKKIGTESI